MPCGRRALLGETGLEDGLAVIRCVEGGRDKSVLHIDDSVVFHDDGGPTAVADGSETALARRL